MYPGKTLAVAFALITAATVAACGSSATPSSAPTGASPAASPAPASSSEHNEADVAFVQQMIPHHAQAVRMAELAPQRASSAQVKQLAAAIQGAQQPEIDQMTAMLKNWGAPVPATPAQGDSGSSGMGDMPGMDHGAGAPAQSGDAGMDHGSMPGMMSSSQMSQLSQASGAAFDRQFLSLMIAHHEGAVQMSSVELRDGRNPEAKTLAQKIIDAQNAEIAEMRRMAG